MSNYRSIYYMLLCAFNVVNTRRVGFALLTFYMSSCASNQSMTYFQNKNNDVKYAAVLASSDPAPLRIQSDDMLAIIVSSMSDETNNIFNLLNNKTITTSQYSAGGSSQPIGYLVDQAGEINLPLIGKVRVAGLTLNEANLYITNQLDHFVKSPTVNVRVLNHKFTIIGEVTRPGVYSLADNPITLPEVIGMAGELTLYARRNSVRLIRTVNNRREIVELDLTSQQILNSPYYFIENNDVVYVNARSSKTLSTERSIQLLPIGVAFISTAAILVNLFNR